MLFNRHTTTLLSQKLIIFGGRKTAAYFNDLHVLDLGKIKTATDCLRLKQSVQDCTDSYIFPTECRIYGVHSCEEWEHATAASRVRKLINLDKCHPCSHLVVVSLGIPERVKCNFNVV